MNSTRGTVRKKSAKKGAPKKKKGASKKRAAMSAAERRAPEGVFAGVAMSAVELRGLQGVLASREFRADTSWPRKEDVPGHDGYAFDVPGNFEAFCIKYRIWPWNREPDARPFQCVRCEPKSETVYYRDAEGRERVAQKRNDYYLAQECR